MFELYVSRDHLRPTQYDAGSLLCIQLASENLAELVEILEVFPASKKLPNWLIGTPTLHDSTSGEVLTGYQAIRFLQQLTIEAAENRGETRATTQKKRVSDKMGGVALLQKKTPSVQGAGGGLGGLLGAINAGNFKLKKKAEQKQIAEKEVSWQDNQYARAFARYDSRFLLPLCRTLPLLRRRFRMSPCL